MKEFGVLVPIVTPCTSQGEIDIKGTQAVCDEMLGAGNRGIFVMGSTGRGAWFSRTERTKFCRIVADYIGSKVPLFAGCMANGLRDMIDNAYFSADAGAQFAVVTAPGYFQYHPNELVSILMQFADHSPIPVLLYDVPVYTGSKFDTKSIVQLVKHENVAGVKDSTADFGRFTKLIAAMKTIEDRYLFQGKEHILAESLLAGASGIISTFSHFAPGLFVEIFQAARDNNLPLTGKLQFKITRLYNLVTECLTKRPAISTLFHLVNLSLQERGVCKNIMLQHEGECAGWLRDKAGEVMEISEQAHEIPAF